MIRYRFEFDGIRTLPPAAFVIRESPVVVDAVELYKSQPFLVESVDQSADPPLVVLRKVRS